MKHLSSYLCLIKTAHQIEALKFYIVKSSTRLQSTMRVLCVAEKPSIAKAVAGHLSGGQVLTVSRLFSFTCCTDTQHANTNSAQYAREVYQKLCLSLRFRASLGSLRGYHDFCAWSYHLSCFPSRVQEMGKPTS